MIESNGAARLLLEGTGNRMKPFDADVKFFMDRAKSGGRGTYATTTTCTDPDRFIDAVGWELPTALRNIGDGPELGAAAWVGQICELWAKLKGYKTDHVYEERRLVAGMPFPESSMECLNAEAQAMPISKEDEPVMNGVDEDGFTVYNHRDGSD